MGQFSWLDCCDNNRQILDNVSRDAYLLIPKEFGGGHIRESCYEGYGKFGDKDVYDLVATWNKASIPEIIRRARNGHWRCSISSKDEENLMKFYHGMPISCELRHIGIMMACYDKDNANLEYPIKITYEENAMYEYCKPSPSDPNQGWSVNEIEWGLNEADDE